MVFKQHEVDDLLSPLTRCFDSRDLKKKVMEILSRSINLLADLNLGSAAIQELRASLDEVNTVFAMGEDSRLEPNTLIGLP